MRQHLLPPFPRQPASGSTGQQERTLGRQPATCGQPASGQGPWRALKKLVLKGAPTLPLPPQGLLYLSGSACLSSSPAVKDRAWAPSRAVQTRQRPSSASSHFPWVMPSEVSSFQEPKRRQSHEGEASGQECLGPSPTPAPSVMDAARTYRSPPAHADHASPGNKE